MNDAVTSAPAYRWVVLSAATVAQMSFSAFVLGLPALAPAIRTEYEISLGTIGVFLGVIGLGLAATLLPWGVVSDRIGERASMTIGLAGAGGGLTLGACAPSFPVFATALALAAGSGASVNSSIGRAVLSWFGVSQRGLAYSIRQAGMVVAAAAAALVLPRIASSYGVRTAIVALAVGCLIGSALSAVAIRGREGSVVSGDARLSTTLLDGRLIRLSLGSSFACVAQMSVSGFVVLFLHDVRNVGVAAAAAVLAASQLLGAVVRIATGVWSDRVHSRVIPLRRIMVAIAVALGAAAALENAPLSVLIPAFVIAGALAMGWNTVSFAAAVELGGPGRGGATVGFQQAILGLAGGLTPLLFAYCVEATSWSAAWAFAAVSPLVGWFTLRALPTSRAYESRQRMAPSPLDP